MAKPKLKLVQPAPAAPMIFKSYGRFEAVTKSAPRYHSGQHCPGCNAQRWWVGRVTVECENCGRVLQI